ncbi:aminotransferase class I/II-fold pyridoxal phosphate-dependent enzyme [Brotaphodocola sp.]|uniref:aminotransferase class I/II-fold pyridoxal phosphate-dependent enzyme n=1 Tax=Brotaphodocola sp. TaxID=3073577 RepID=UPI003D7D8D1F
MRKEDLLISRLKHYADSDACPFHMPGHKRQAAEGMRGEFPNPFAIDITEIDGFDNLHHPEGILRESMDWAAGVYGTARTWYLVNGSSCGILSAISACVHPGGRILMSRNCHKSAYHGVILNQLKTDYVYPQILPELWIQGGVLAEDVEKMLQKNPDTEAVLIVSPTYDGMVSDVQAIADIVHRYGLPLIVDEAHGAHFPFGGEEFPVSAVDCGADLVIQSLHKTLPSLTQTAVLHLTREGEQSGRIDIGRVERYLQIYQTSSPSYVLMASIESSIYEMEQGGREQMEAFAGRLRRVYSRLERLKHLKPALPHKLRKSGTERRLPAWKAGIYDMDPAKIVISCRGCVKIAETAFKNREQICEEICEESRCEENRYEEDKSLEIGKRVSREKLTGEILGDWLRQKFHIEMEMCGADYVVAIATFSDTEERLERLCTALEQIDAQLETEESFERSSAEDNTAMEWELPEICMTPADAVDAPWELLPMEACAGRISGEFVYLYPPGIPIIAPGEKIKEEMVRQICAYKKMELPVQGMADREAKFLRVCTD